MNREEALQKIKKCMALGKSAEPHEAAAALRQAQKLMERFGLSASDVSLADVNEERTRSASAGFALWEAQFAKVVADAFGCERYRDLSRRFTGSGNCVLQQHYVFVGIDTAPVLATYAHSVLARQCTKARTAHIKKQPKSCKPSTKTARGDAFAYGWVIAAAAVVERFAQPEQNRELILEYMGKHHSDLVTEVPRNTTKGYDVDGHYYSGHAQGQNAQLHHGVHARQQKQLTGTASSL